MCTNRALVDSLECYMDELLDNFEDFVKKSVVVIFVAVGLLVAMIGYVLKTTADRTQPSAAAGDMARRSSQNFRNRIPLESNFVTYGYQDNKGTSTNVITNTETQNQDEKVLKDIGLSGCFKPSCGLSATRLTLTSLPPVRKKCSASNSVPSKKTSTYDKQQESCCSMCCDDKRDL